MSETITFVAAPLPAPDRRDDPIGICVVGLGPRGLSVLERLCANASRVAPRTVHVQLVDPCLGIGGRVWRTDQSNHLLMNTVAAQVTMFVDESVECVGPVVPGPSLHEWARMAMLDAFPEQPTWVCTEASALTPDAYPTRAFYGQYLICVYQHREDGGMLHYEPSGDEPHMIAGSRRGVPYHARGENQKGAYGRHTRKHSAVASGFGVGWLGVCWLWTDGLVGSWILEWLRRRRGLGGS